MKIYKILIICILLIINGFTPKAQQPLSIQEINQKLGRGMNMGNMFEAPSEGEWGNPFKDDYFQKIAEKGFQHVRIPVRWDVSVRASQTAPYTISATFLQRIKYVVDLALVQKLYVVINMHHHEDLFANPEITKARFLSQWTQIAEFFKSYDQRLLFEVMNEPHDKLTPELWNVYFGEALANIRKTNPTRAVLMGTAEYGGLSGVSKLKIPDDKNLIVTVHYYNPFNFTHQGADWVGTDAQKWLGTKWEDLAIERNQIMAEFDFLSNWAKQKNIPVHVGEFGAYEKADYESRVRWTNFLARWLEQQGFSWAYWEFSAGFGIYKPASNTYNDALVDALVKNPLPEPKTLPTKELYKSNFSTNSDGFSLSVQPTSTATFTPSNGRLVVDVRSASQNGWHVQLNKPNIPLINGKRYLVTIKGMADKEVSFTNYLGKNASPYNSYSGYTGITFTTKEKEISYTFLMNDPSDSTARLTFDLGNSIAKIEIISVVIEEVLTTTATILATMPTPEPELVITPNPTHQTIIIRELEGFDTLQLIDQKGIVLQSVQLEKSTEIEINMRDNAAGVYFLLFEKKGKVVSKKVTKL
ncbi:MAG: cellulase family glycosylhydrolase [Spirosomataceae bacterium]